ncbi:uncharacterized protein FFB20_12332 [Fusarium fujikuroi]|nr:uncharacterized protein FFE2_07287 [Fusarium fujikuroi]SCO05457.1 uncharacterized protein FFB20_12332 [Fusarium fujikuroi]VZH91376.1 unnamed protein product [Fusarium fujikuroi]
MASSNPFAQLSAELMITILGAFDSTKDLQSIIRADPRALGVFLQNKQRILPSLRSSLDESCSQSLVQAVMIHRLRQSEADSHDLTRLQAEQIMKPVLTSPPEPCRLMKLNLGALGDLYQLFRQSRSFMDYYKTRMGEYDDTRTREHSNRRIRIEECPGTGMQEIVFESSLPERKKPRLWYLDSTGMQRAYLLFEAYRHSLWFSTNLLQDYGTGDDRYDFHIPWNFIYNDKLLCIRTFQAIFVFLFREYNSLLRQVHGRINGSDYNCRFDLTDTTWRIPSRQFLQRGMRDRLQFTAYLTSHGFHQFLNIQDMDYDAQEERILSLYVRYLDLKADRQTCPMVVGADLEHSLMALCYRERNIELGGLR